MSERALPGGMPESPPCPFCQGVETEIFSTFGSQLSVSTFWCRDCRSPFEFFKWGSGSDPAPRTAAGGEPAASGRGTDASGTGS